MIHIYYDSHGNRSFTRPPQPDSWSVADYPISQLVIKAIMEKEQSLSTIAQDLGYSNQRDAMENLKALLMWGKCSKRLTAVLPKVLGISPNRLCQALQETEIEHKNEAKFIPAKRYSADHNLLIDNFELLLARQTTILETPEFFFVPIPNALCAICVLGSFGGDLALGHLLTAWSQDLFRLPCAICSKSSYLITYVRGLSIVFSIKAVCPHCRKIVLPGEGFVDLGKVSTIRKSRPNYVTVSKSYETTEFHWNGIRPVTRTREVLKQVVTPVSLETLIEELKGDFPTG